MEPILVVNDDAPDEYLTYRYLLDGYGALGLLIVQMSSAGRRRFRTAQRRRREIQLLRTLYAASPGEGGRHRRSA